MMNQDKKSAGVEEQSEPATKADLELTDDEKIDIVAKRILENTSLHFRNWQNRNYPSPTEP